jgi:DNA segregation ATPase FtsK/SpoIIIE, S-DNA-T family
LIAVLTAGGGALGLVVWLLAKVGRVLVKIAEALVAAAVVFVVVWLVVRGVVWAFRQTVTRWRTSLAASTEKLVGDPGTAC